MMMQQKSSSSNDTNRQIKKPNRPKSLIFFDSFDRSIRQYVAISNMFRATVQKHVDLCWIYCKHHRIRSKNSTKWFYGKIGGMRKKNVESDGEWRAKIPTSMHNQVAFGRQNIWKGRLKILSEQSEQIYLRVAVNVIGEQR